MSNSIEIPFSTTLLVRDNCLCLTAEGKSLLAAALPVWESTHSALEGALPEGNADRLRQDLLTLA
jgi:hypothetical protein